MTLDAVERRSFTTVSAVVPRGPGEFGGDVDPEWTIGGKPNGGYLLAMIGRAATWEREHDHVIAASAHFVRSPEPGPVVIETEMLRVGRSASQVRGRLLQGDQVCIEALVTTSHLQGGGAPYWDRGLPPPTSLRPEECVPFVPRLGGLVVAIMDQVEVRFDPATAGFLRGEPAGRGELRGWLTLPAGESFDPLSLIFSVDGFPPATLDVEFAGWVPTFELTVYVRALPVPGPVQILQRAQLVDAGRLDETCFVWDSSGRLVAQGTQLAGVRLGVDTGTSR